MLDLLQQYSLRDILIFIIILGVALKGCFSFIDDFTHRSIKIFNRTYQKPKQLQEGIKKMEESINKLSKKVDILMKSDRDAIKAFITREHHYFVYQRGWIDDYSLDCIERRYTHYNEQGGNSFIQTLMTDLRNLPKQEPKQ